MLTVFLFNVAVVFEMMPLRANPPSTPFYRAQTKSLLLISKLSRKFLTPWLLTKLGYPGARQAKKTVFQTFMAIWVGKFR